MVNKKTKGDLLSEFEAKKIALEGGELWVSYIEYGYNKKTIEQACKVSYFEKFNSINFENCDIAEFQLTGLPSSNCCDDGFGEYALSLHSVIEQKINTKEEVVDDLIKLAEEAIESKDSELYDLMGDSARSCEKIKNDWQRRLDNAKRIIGG